MIVLAVLILLALVVESVATTSDREGNLAIHAMSSDSTGRSGTTHDPYIDRHASIPWQSPSHSKNSPFGGMRCPTL